MDYLHHLVARNMVMDGVIGIQDTHSLKGHHLVG